MSIEVSDNTLRAEWEVDPPPWLVQLFRPCHEEEPLRPTAF